MTGTGRHGERLRALRRWSVRRGGARGSQGGYILMTVIAMLGLLSILGAVLLGMTLTALKISTSFRDSLDNTSAADSALQLRVHELQRDALAAGTDCYGATDNGGGTYRYPDESIQFPGGDSIDVIVDCVPTGANTPVRDVTLVAYAVGGSSPDAKARIQITDEVGGQSRPGAELRICDWQLGENIRSNVAGC